MIKEYVLDAITNSDVDKNLEQAQVIFPRYIFLFKISSF